MEDVKIFIDGLEKNVFGLFYIYDSKYYFIYTEKQIDENGYVILYMTQVGKETKNTEAGLVDTGFMVGVEISDPEEQKKAQTSISYIVEDKKNNTVNPQIQYLPMSMLTNLKIVSKKRFRLLKSIMVDNFKLSFDDNVVAEGGAENVLQPQEHPILEVTEEQSVQPQLHQSTFETGQTLQPLAQINGIIPVGESEIESSTSAQVVTPETQEMPVRSQAHAEQESEVVAANENESNVIIDYRAKYFEEQEKNKELEARIELLTQKLEEIKKIVE